MLVIVAALNSARVDVAVISEMISHPHPPDRPPQMKKTIMLDASFYHQSSLVILHVGRFVLMVSMVLPANQLVVPIGGAMLQRWSRAVRRRQ